MKGPRVKRGNGCPPTEPRKTITQWDSTTPPGLEGGGIMSPEKPAGPDRIKILNQKQLSGTKEKGGEIAKESLGVHCKQPKR